MYRYRKYNMQKSALLSALLLAVFLNARLFAEQEEPNKPENFFEMSLEELMKVEVVSASRQPQKMGETSVPVSIITAEDIHYSGLTDIPDMLQFSPGVDVVKLSRFRYAVGVRGLHDFISDRTLTLINGRIADSPLFGGSEFYRLPVFPEDIERIEVVRGPGGAAWGANAFTGVINIITKKPEDVLGYFGTSTINEFGDTFTHLRYGTKQGKWSWRASVGYEDTESSDEAGAGRYESRQSAVVKGLIGFPGNYDALDFSRKLRFDGEAIYNYSDRTDISFGAGYTHGELGDYEFLGVYPRVNAWNETVRPYVRLNHRFENGSTGYLQWFGNFANTKAPTIMKYYTMENDIEAQLNFEPVEGHQMSVGGNFRFIRLDTEMHQSYQLQFNGEPVDEQMAGVFLIDRWKVSGRLAIEGQIRGDWYSETQEDWSTRLTALYALDEQRNHTLRFSFAKAFRAPLLSLRKAETHRLALSTPPYPLDSHVFNALPPSNLENEEAWALECGYTGKITDHLTLRADTYYQRFRKLIGYQITSTAYSTTYKPDNIDGADSWGAEVELALQGKAGRLSAWYAYNDFQEDASHQHIRSYAPAQHKAGVSGRLFLTGGWVFNANFRYTGTTPVIGDTTIYNIGTSHRLDLTVARQFSNGCGEIMIGVSDVFNNTRGPYFAIGGLTAHETPGRTFFARVQLRF